MRLFFQCDIVKSPVPWIHPEAGDRVSPRRQDRPVRRLRVHRQPFQGRSLCLHRRTLRRPVRFAPTDGAGVLRQDLLPLEGPACFTAPRRAQAEASDQPAPPKHHCRVFPLVSLAINDEIFTTKCAA